MFLEDNFLTDIFTNILNVKCDLKNYSIIGNLKIRKSKKITHNTVGLKISMLFILQRIFPQGYYFLH